MSIFNSPNKNVRNNTTTKSLNPKSNLIFRTLAVLFLIFFQAIVPLQSVFALTPPVLNNDPSDPIALTSVSGIWTNINGGSGYQGLNTSEIRWGTPADGWNKSGLRFSNSGNQSFDTGDTFYLGMLTHMNWGTEGGTAADGATLQITLNFERPDIPNAVLNYNFNIEETVNWSGFCKDYQQSGTPCDDKITFPNSYGTQVFTIDDIKYTLVIDGFKNAFPAGATVSSFITEEQKENDAFLVGHLSSVLVERPNISLTKKLNGESVEAAPGPSVYVDQDLSWTYIVQNSGNVTLSNVIVIDNPSQTITCPKNTLIKGETMICTATSKAIAGQYTNEATVTGTYTGGASPVSASDKSWYFGIQKGHIIVDVVTNPSGSPQVFSFTTAGSGYLGFDLTDASAKNDQILVPGTYSVAQGAVTGWDLTSAICSDGSPVNAISLASGETVTCVFTNTRQTGTLQVVKNVINDNSGTSVASDFSFSVNGGLPVAFNSNGQNNLTVFTGTYSVEELNAVGYRTKYFDCLNMIVTNGGIATCTIENDDDSNPSITITKNGPSAAREGDTIDYTFIVTNNGDASLTGITLSDDLTTNESCPSSSLNPGQSMTCTASYVVPTGRIADITNHATVSGIDSLRKTVTASAQHTLDVIHPSIQVIKNGPASAHEGDLVNYTFTVTNTGDITLTGITVSDNLTTNESCPSSSLNPGQSMTCTASYPVPTPQIADVDNEVVASGIDPLGNTVVGRSEHSLDVLHPQILVIKEGPVSAHEGDTITYTFTVSNPGDVSLSVASVIDSIAGNGEYLSGDTNTNSMLDTDESWIYTKTYIIPTGQTDNVLNTVTVCATEGLEIPNGIGLNSLSNLTQLDNSRQNLICNTSPEHSLDVLHPSITITKNGPSVAREGDTVDYTFTVTNNGDASLTGITLSDDLTTNESCPSSSLNPGQSMTCTASYVVPTGRIADITNHATVSGIDSLRKTVTASAQHTLDVITPVPVPTELPKTGTDLTLTEAIIVYLTVSGMFSAIGFIGRSIRRHYI